jgi:hypothetical protein
MMKIRIPVAIFISMLLPLSLTACASSGEANDYFGNSVSMSGNETILCEKRCVD